MAIPPPSRVDDLAKLVAAIQQEQAGYETIKSATIFSNDEAASLLRLQAKEPEILAAVEVVQKAQDSIASVKRMRNPVMIIIAGFVWLASLGLVTKEHGYRLIDLIFMGMLK